MEGSARADAAFGVGVPKPKHVRAALANIPLRVHQDILLTDQMFIPAREAVLLLPAKTRYEQDDGGHATTTERRVAFSPHLCANGNFPTADGKAHLQAVALPKAPVSNSGNDGPQAGSLLLRRKSGGDTT